MDSLSRRARDFIGSRLVRLGLAVMGFSREMSRDIVVETEEDDEDEEHELHEVGIELSNAAREMIQDGRPTPQPKTSVDVPLKGSLAERRIAARREAGR